MTSRLSKPAGMPAWHGFSLLELLTAIAVIAILATLLVPTVTGIRKNTRSVQCVSNLRALASAMDAYLLDNDNRLPRLSTGATSTTPATNWVFKVSGYPDRNTDYVGITYQNGQRLHNVSSGGRSILLCRENIERSGITSSPSATTYLLNGSCSELLLSEAVNPARTAFFVEGIPVGNTWALGTTNGSLISAAIHGDHSNVLFLDGHIERMASVPPASDTDFWRAR